MSLKIALLALLCLSAGAAVAAAETERADINFSGRSYQYTFVTRLDGSSAAIHAVVTDYANLRQINDDIVASRVLARYPNGELKRQLKLRHCILLFCFDMDFVERVQEAPGHIITTIVPEESTFEDGIAAWQIEAIDATHTRVSVNARQTPRFWIPPVIGPLILKQVFLAEIAETCANIERLARTHPL